MASTSTRASARTTSRRTKRAASPTPSAEGDDDVDMPEQGDEAEEPEPAPSKPVSKRAGVGKGRPSRPVVEGSRRSARISSATSLSGLSVLSRDSVDGNTTAGSATEEEESIEVDEEDEDERAEEEEEEVMPKPKARRGRIVSQPDAPAPVKSKGKRKMVVDSDEEEEAGEAPPAVPETALDGQPVLGDPPTADEQPVLDEQQEQEGMDVDIDNDKTPAPARAVSGTHRRPMSPTADDSELPETAMLAPAPPSESSAPPETADRPPIPRLRLDADSEADAEEAERTIRLDSTPGSPGSPAQLVDLPPPTPGRIPSTPRFAPPTPGPSQLPLPTAKPKPRLTIHKLVLVNFKSYADRQEIGPFHKSFSAIVGPNGSGKSNTIDALLFVFGYRASKMRQGKLSELIHNSAGKEGIETCSVEVWFREIVDLVSVWYWPYGWVRALTAYAAWSRRLPPGTQLSACRHSDCVPKQLVEIHYQ